MPLSAPGYLDVTSLDITSCTGEILSHSRAERSRTAIRQALRVKWPLLVVALVAGAICLAWAPGITTGAHAKQAKLVLSHYSEAGAVEQTQAPTIDASPAVAQPEPAALAPATQGRSIAYNVVASPSVSVAKIEAVLRQYGSPAAGRGQVLYDLGLRYGIDPAYALAFFVHESGCGTQGVARTTKSLGNIRWVAGFDNFEGYRSYPSWESGMEDWYKLIKELYVDGWSLRTVDAIVPVYAPAADRNSPSAYIASVKRMVDSWRGQ